MQVGQKVYFLRSNHEVVEAEIRSINGNLYTLKLSSGGAIRLPKGRLYDSCEAAESQLPKKSIVRHKKNQYDYIDKF